MELPFKLILASGSPRRRELLAKMNLPFEVLVSEIDESHPEHLKGAQIASHIAEMKAEPFLNSIEESVVVLTADTIVCKDGEVLHKPNDEADAHKMLKSLSDDWHEVITAVCFTRLEKQFTVHETTRVKFGYLSNSLIDYYISEFKPLDKAGAYGIQEWIGLVAIERIEGSYTNVVGLPTQLVYQTLMDMAG